jgi:hypothetical protein
MASLSFVKAIILLLAFLIAKALCANTTLGPIPLPAPTGAYLPALRIEVLVDHSRPDPFNASENNRRFPISIYTPIPRSECFKICQRQYMPSAVAAAQDAEFFLTDLTARVQLSGVCCEHAPEAGRRDYPLVIWSPGFRESRLGWAAQAQYVSSNGFKVVLVDHPGDAVVVVFPDGQIVRAVFADNNSTTARAFALNVATQDVLFAIDKFTETKDSCAAGDKKVALIGHGTISSQPMLNDSLNGKGDRIVGGVNIDGRYEGPTLTDGNGAGYRSFLLWTPPSGPENQTSWNEWWNTTDKFNPGDWRLELSIANTTQGTFSDLALIADVSGLRESDAKNVTAVLGTINGTRSTAIQVAYASAFFDMVLRGKKEPLLEGSSSAYPEVGFVRFTP